MRLQQRWLALWEATVALLIRQLAAGYARHRTRIVARVATALALLTLLVGPNSPLVDSFGLGAPTAYAHGLTSQNSPNQGKPNRYDPHQATVTNLHLPKPLSANAHPGSPQGVAHSGFKPHGLGTVAVDPVQGATFLTTDGKFEVDVPPGAITSGDISAAGGKVSLQVSQIAPPSGSNAGGSGIVSFGTFLVQVVDAHGVLAKQGLRKPVNVQLDYVKASGVDLAHAFVVMNGGLPTSLTGAVVSTTTTAPSATTRQTVTAATIALGSYSTGKTTWDSKHHKLIFGATVSTPSSSMTWNTTGPIAFFGKPDIFNADLSAGSLSSSLPIDVPAGPGGLTPPISLSYSSAGVSEDHSVQSAAGWVGEGWNLSMGSINWSERDGTAGCVASNTCSPVWESQWQLSDPFGTGSELIPPNLGVSTYIDDTPNSYYYNGTYYNVPSVWHTANESYAKIVSYRSTITFGGNNINPPCFRVWLKNGLMEEFGCTSDSLQEYVANPGADGVAEYYISGWLLDMITDPKGNQIHFTYQRDNQAVAGLTYPRDTVLSTIEWDSPTCQNAQTMCTGASWTPLMRVSFSAAHAATRLTNTPAGCNTGSALRCDDPLDLSGSQGLVAPAVQSTFELNDLYVQVRGSGSAGWNTLKDYQFSYEDNGPNTITDASTGKSQSSAGYFDLTKVSVVGDNNSTALPTRTFSYTTIHEYYEDDTYHPNPTTNCGPADGPPSSMAWNTGNGSGCILWSRSEDGNSRYLTSASNGMGMAQTFSWDNARDNMHGVNTGGNNADPLYCNTHQSGYPCNEADDQSWSHAVLTQRASSVQQITQNGQGGAQTTNTITMPTAYTYQIATNIPGKECGDCGQGMYWGNENQNDYLDYYNPQFMGFVQTTVSNPDGSVEAHKYYSTEGWGVYDNTQITNCASNMSPPGPSPCPTVPWWHLTNVAHGHEYETDLYDTNGTTLLKKATTQYQAVCPPTGVGGSGTLTGYGNFNGNLVSELNHGNPVADCAVQTTRSDSYTYDGSTASGVPDVTTTYTYDSYGRPTSTTTTSNNGGATGSPTTIVSKPAYVWNDSIATSQTGATGTHLIDFTAFGDTEDSSGNRYKCSYTSYDGQGYTTGQTSSLTHGEVTRSDAYTSCGVAPNYTPGGQQISSTHIYDSFGNQLASDDADAVAGNAAHLGCTVGTTKYSSCSAYDTTFDTLPVSSTNALNQATTTGYNATTDATGGYGLWPTSTKDFNQQTTSFGYDALGRMTSQTLPGEGTGLTTATWTYTDWCATTGAQTPCVEMDETKRLNGTTTITKRSFYDGYGQMVESRTPGPAGQDIIAYATYDAQGHMTFETNSYFVTAYTGAAGPNAYSIPDSTQVGTHTTYDGLQRVKSGSDPLSNTTNTNLSVVCNAAGTGDTACYEQSLVTDANGHQSGTLTDGFGREVYAQRYTGNSGATYALYVTTKYTYDYLSDLTQILQPDGATKTTFTFDAAGRKTGMTDPDKGTESYTYDANGNLVQAVDARGAAGTVYAGYDGLDRMLWRNSSNTATGAYDTFTYDSTASGNYGAGRLTSESFTGGPNNTLTGSYAYTYDLRGQQTKSALTVGSASYPVQKSFDDSGNVLSQTYPDGEVVSNGLDANGWLTGLTTAQSGTTTTLMRNAAYSGVGGAGGLMTAATLGQNPNAAEDNFTRANQTGWGTSTNGDSVANNAWGLDGAGSLSYVTIANNQGVFGYQGSKNVAGIASLGSATHDGGDALAKWSISAIGNGVPFISLNACSDKSCYYGARVNTSSGNLELVKASGGKTTVETSTAFTATANVSYWTRLNVNHNGASTVVNVKVWQDGTAEPSSWTLAWTDTSPLAAGLVGAGGTWARAGVGESISYACYGYSSIPAISAVACGIGGAGLYNYSASFDADHRMTGVGLTRISDSAVLFQSQPSYDAVSNVTAVSTTLPTGNDTQRFCYDEQNRLTWSGSVGTPSCTGTAITPGTLTSAQYTQTFGYDTMGRLTSGPLGAYTYGSSAHVHAATAIGTGWTASYDASGNMTCRAPSNSTTCAGTQTGAQIGYNLEGYPVSWQNAPSNPSTTDGYLYDGQGNRVEQQVTTGLPGSPVTTTTVYVGNIEEVATTGSSTTTTTYYYAGSKRIATSVNGALSYQGVDQLGSANVSLTPSNSMQAAQLFSPYGASRYSSGTMPGSYGFTGQRSDATTGLDYYISRYYDPVAGQFTSADSVLPGAGYDPLSLSRYAYVAGNPETHGDADGHCWPLCTILIGAVVGAAIGAATSVVSQVASGQSISSINWGEVGKQAAVGAVTGAISGLAGPEAGFVARAAIDTAASVGGQVVSNALEGKPLGDGVLTAAATGALMSVGMGAAGEVLGKVGSRFFGQVAEDAEGEAASAVEQVRSGCMSFASDTKVATPSGEKPIASLQTGDKVTAVDPKTGKSSAQTVEATSIHTDDNLVDVTLRVANPAPTTTQAKADASANRSRLRQSLTHAFGAVAAVVAATTIATGAVAPPATVAAAPTYHTEVIHTTTNHPWLTADHGWLPAGFLHLGEPVVTLSGVSATVEAVHVVPGVARMWDLTVANVHTFAVGDAQAVVHNADVCKLPNPKGRGWVRLYRAVTEDELGDIQVSKVYRNAGPRLNKFFSPDPETAIKFGQELEASGMGRTWLTSGKFPVDMLGETTINTIHEGTEVMIPNEFLNQFQEGSIGIHGWIGGGKLF